MITTQFYYETKNFNFTTDILKPLNKQLLVVN